MKRRKNIKNAFSDIDIVLFDGQERIKKLDTVIPCFVISSCSLLHFIIFFVCCPPAMVKVGNCEKMKYSSQKDFLIYCFNCFAIVLTFFIFYGFTPLSN